MVKIFFGVFIQFDLKFDSYFNISREKLNSWQFTRAFFFK